MNQDQSSARKDDVYEPSPGAEKALKIGKQVGLEQAEKFVRYVQPMNQEERMLAFSGWQAAALSHMTLALGPDAALAVLDGLREVAVGKASDDAKAARNGDGKRAPDGWGVNKVDDGFGTIFECRHGLSELICCLEIVRSGKSQCICEDNAVAPIIEALKAPVSEIAATTGPLKLDTDSQVFFYEQDHYYLSNFSAFRVEFKGVWFDTAEQAYHFQRFDDRYNRRAVLTAISAHEAFRHAQDNRAAQRPDWDALKVDVMRDILRAKVAQHEYVRRKLLQTEERELVENSWRDPFWGWGPNRDGLNMLGKLWMEVRAELRRANG